MEREVRLAFVTTITEPPNQTKELKRFVSHRYRYQRSHVHDTHRMALSYTWEVLEDSG